MSGATTVIRAIAVIAVIASAAASCAVGIEPPEPTGMVRVDGTAPFWYGPVWPCIQGTKEGTVEGDAACSPDWFKQFISAGNPEPPLRLELDTFYIDVHEVTNLQYEFCVAVGRCTAPVGVNGPLSRTEVDYYRHPDGLYDNHPVVLIRQDQAAQYCEFVGKRLPTEFEWERVAKGPGETKRIWPVEEVITEYADFCKYKLLAADCNLVEPEPQPVPEAGPKRDYARDYGDRNDISDYVLEGGKPIYHLFSNVSEWTSSKYVKGNTCLTPLPDGCTPTHEREGLNAEVMCRGLCNVKGQCDTWGDPLEAGAACTERVGDPSTSEKCYYQCVGPDLVATPVCGKPDPDKEYKPEDLTGSDEPTTDVVVKGGNLTVGKDRACNFRSSARDAHTQIQSQKSHTQIGFRCAYSGDAVPEGYPSLAL